MRTAPSNRTRAERLQLVARLDRAGDAAELLHSKEEALERERARLEGHTARAEAEWRHRSSLAASQLVRARTMGASDEIRALIEHGADPAMVTTRWQASMGIMYPGSVESAPGAAPALSSTSALGPAIEAYRDALEAAATFAATSAAVERLDTELMATRRRRRAIEERLQPDLEQALGELDLHLDELDREEALRVRAATRPQGANRPC